ncbi:MAG: hypothetical protein ABF242_09835, partial [Flavobacteriales bacterium]
MTRLLYKFLFVSLFVFNSVSVLAQGEVSSAEYFWGLTDPGTGSGTAMVAFDGNFDEAIEIA